jgi:WD40 repeat protein
MTADSGENSLLIIWDTTPRLELSIRKANAQTVYSATMASLTAMAPLPVKTLFDPHNGAGVISVAFSIGSKHILTLGADSPQTVCIWYWGDSLSGSNELRTPIAKCAISGSRQNSIEINGSDHFEFMTTGRTGVYFFSWEEGDVLQHTPLSNARDFKDSEFQFTHSTFVPEMGQALSGTVDGDVVVWANKSLGNLSTSMEKGCYATIKLLR